MSNGFPMEYPKRKTNRLTGYDYSQPGAYFVTICANQRSCIFSRISVGAIHESPAIELTAIGSLIEIKGFEYFIKAATTINSNIEFRIYGEGALKNNLIQLAKNRVKFMGYSDNIIEELYKSIDWNYGNYK